MMKICKKKKRAKKKKRNCFETRVRIEINQT